MAIFVGIDDTDSPDGMCTTYLGLLAVESLTRRYDLISYPCLVRLNPTVPWKTRGNGAISFQIGRGMGKRIRVGSFRGRTLYCYGTGETQGDADEVLDLISNLVDEHAHIGANTHPGVVVSPVPLPEDLYWLGVRGVLEIGEVIGVLSNVGAVWKGWGSGRGIIGASCAIAWPRENVTWEAITYRRPDLIGIEREIDRTSVLLMDRSLEGTFNNYDPEEDRILINPRTPCPVLFGIRGESPDVVREGMVMIRSEEPYGYLIWMTNQATDDHLTDVRSTSEIVDFMSVRLKGTVSRGPRSIRGGHVIFVLQTSSGEVDCAAYEPTKGLRDVVRLLRPGDEVLVCGSVRSDPRTINLEKICILRVSDRYNKAENPLCPACGRHMKSRGHGRGYRCRRCGTRASEEEGRFTSGPAPAIGWYEATPSAHRHLTMPIRRMRRLNGSRDLLSGH